MTFSPTSMPGSEPPSTEADHGSERPSPERLSPERLSPERPSPERLAPTGAWRPGDPSGDRQFATLFTAEEPFKLESGHEIGPVEVAYETWGSLSPDRSNAVLVLHALTGDSHAAGAAAPGHPSPGWWGPVIGPGAAIDTRRWFVVCPNVLGGCQGTTGPSSRRFEDAQYYGSSFPPLTVRDQVAIEAVLADELGIGSWAAVVGGSMGGMRALEWAVSYPERTERAIVLACGGAASAEQIALCAVQASAIRLDSNFAGGDYYDAGPGKGPTRGLGLARRIGQISYRTGAELDDRFGRTGQGDEDPLAGGRYSIESYLDHHADKLARKFDANSYLVLSRAMDHHDLGRSRGGIRAALARVTARVTVAGIDSDRLYPLRQQQALADDLPSQPPVRLVRSPYGHDAFLLEANQVGEIISEALDP